MTIVDLEVSTVQHETITIPHQLEVKNGTLSLMPAGGFARYKDVAPDGLVYEFYNEKLSIHAFKK